MKAKRGSYLRLSMTLRRPTLTPTLTASGMTGRNEAEVWRVECGCREMRVVIQIRE